MPIQLQGKSPLILMNLPVIPHSQRDKLKYIEPDIELWISPVRELINMSHVNVLYA